MLWWSMLGFGLAILPLTVTPGVSLRLLMQRVHQRGARSGLAVIAGSLCGLLCHATLAGLGLFALVMRSSEAFTVIKFVGAAYLIVLGLRTLWQARRQDRGGPDQNTPAGGRLPWNGYGDFTQGLLSNVLNPKAASVYLTIAPQFLHLGAPVLPQMLQLCVAQWVVVGGWLLTWTAVVHLSRRTFGSLSFRRLLDRVSGLVLIVLGLRTAATTR